MAYRTVEKNRILPWTKFESRWEVIRAGWVWLGFALSLVLVYLAWFNLIDGFLPPLFENHTRSSVVVIATVLTLFSMQLIRFVVQSVVDNLFYQDTANFQGAINYAVDILSKIDTRPALRQFLLDDLPVLLQVKSIALHPSTQPAKENLLILPLNMGNRALGCIAIGPKCSERAFSRDERDMLRHLQEQVSMVLSGIQLTKAREEAEKVSQLKNTFLTNMSHQLGTPLNTVINSTALVAEGAFGEVSLEQAEFLNRAVQGSEHLMNLLNEILDITKIESRQLTLRLLEINIEAVVEDVVPMIEGMLDKKPVKLVVQVSPNIPPVMADRQRIRQVLLNILANATRFTQKGEIRITARRELNQVLISVADTGIGIAPENLALIFEDYQQVVTGGKQKLQFKQRDQWGTGLGMPIAKALVELHNGQIWVESEPGQGSVFTFTLPLLMEN